MERQLTEVDAQNAGLSSLKNSLSHCWPGNIVSYDAGQETATVQIGVNDVRFDVDTGARISEPFPQMSGIPVAWPRFGGYVIKGSLNQFDPVIMLALDLDPTPWRVAGRTLKPVDPADVRRFGGQWWFAFPTDISLNPTPSSPGGTLTIGAEGQQPLIEISATGIKLGASASEFVALANLVATNLTNIGLTLTPLAAYVNGIVAPGTVPAYVQTPVAASITQAQ